MKKKIKIGRWTITNNGIQTTKENNSPVEYSISDIWSVQQKGEIYVYYLPVHLCSKAWISNLDLLDFNSAFLVCQEIFENKKPKDFPKVSWSETLRIQYKRFSYSLDINSFEGRKQYEYEKEYRANLTMEEMHELCKIDLNRDYSKEPEVYGDGNSRKN
ncbi:hypothetical protein [Abyssalbus ytuae]|uniref:Uncharacterized protein n=1 Tax=Abyssalbus ytuae TaxID=2926907 RepID=A0A9E6ZWL7_9FLAO|nr:hypothetical protein [Abyssalbus ytuae]UOB18151.1 hypothetical protein MQE35_02350 [Abyssalbus ytuae]